MNILFRYWKNNILEILIKKMKSLSLILYFTVTVKESIIMVSQFIFAFSGYLKGTIVSYVVWELFIYSNWIFFFFKAYVCRCLYASKLPYSKETFRIINYSKVKSRNIILYTNTYSDKPMIYLNSNSLTNNPDSLYKNYIIVCNMLHCI